MEIIQFICHDISFLLLADTGPNFVLAVLICSSCQGNTKKVESSKKMGSKNRVDSFISEHG